MTKIADFMKKYYHLLAADIVTLFIAFVICAFFVEAVSYAIDVLLYFLCIDFGRFALFMFLMMFITASLNLSTPLKPLVIVNLSLSITAGFVLFVMLKLIDYDFYNWIGRAFNLYLILFMYLLILLPNLILYIKFRKQQGEYSFAKNITSAIILSCCHIPTMVLIVWYVSNMFFVYF